MNTQVLNWRRLSGMMPVKGRGGTGLFGQRLKLYLDKVVLAMVNLADPENSEARKASQRCPQSRERSQVSLRISAPMTSHWM